MTKILGPITTHERLRCARWLVCVGVAGAAACGTEAPGATGPEEAAPVAIVSDPVAAAESAAASSLSMAPTSAGSPDLVYISLPPGALSSGAELEALNRSSGDNVAAPIVEGGFGPVPIAAAVGDELAFVVVDGSRPKFEWSETVPRRNPPIVVRTYPPRGKRDVPVASSLLIVFSEPMDWRTLSGGTIRLAHDGYAVPGRVEATADRLAAMFTPDQELAHDTDYVLSVGDDAMDWDGDSLGAEVLIPFHTAASASSDPTRPASTVTFALGRYAFVGDSFLIELLLTNAEGVPAWPVRDPVNWTSSDTSIVKLTPGEEADLSPGFTWVRVAGMGSATITATTRGQAISRVLRTIIPDPPLSDDLAIESFSVVEFGYRRSGSGNPAYDYAPTVTVRDRKGRGLEVYGVQFNVPGLGATSFCAARRSIPAGRSVDLFREIYGDFELSFSGDARAAPGPATAAIYFIDAAGVAGQVRVTGQVSPGPLPTTYSGGAIADPWDCILPSLPW